MNKAILMGRLTKDPDMIRKNDTVVARFGLAIDRPYKRENEPTADFVNCVAFGGTAEFIEKYFGKGAKIAIDGHIQTGSYKANDGHTVYTTDIVCERVEFCERKADSTPQTDNDNFVNVPEGIDEDLPFA